MSLSRPSGGASLTEERMIELMQYADGELSAEDTARVKNALATDEEARTFLQELGVLSGLVQEAEPLTVLEAETFDAVDTVMAAVAKAEGEEEKPAPKTTRAVVSLDAARERRRRVSVFVATGIALAAGIALILRSQPDAEHGNTAQNHGVQSPPQSVQTAQTVQTSQQLAHAPDLPASSSEASQQVHAGADKTGEPGVEVNVSDSPRSGFSVFYLPASGASSASAVVWIDESPGGNH